MDSDDYEMYSLRPHLPSPNMYQKFDHLGDDYTLYTKKIPSDEAGDQIQREIEHHIKELTGMINYSGNSPDWVKSKISKAALMISEIANYLHGEVGEAQDMHMSEYLLRSETNEFEPLKKSTKQYKQMLGNPAEHPEALETAKKMPNSNWGTWVVRNYRANPEKFHQIKEDLHHYAGSTHIPEIANIRFDRSHDFDAGLNQLKTAEDNYNDRISRQTNIVKPNPTTRKILDVGNGMAWYSLGTGGCQEEGKAMGHCGNVPSQKPHHDILSLRSTHKLKGKEYHEPHLTFINDKENNILGEMKGRANEKPNPRYHEAIAKLLASGHVPMGGGYAEGNNFHIDDLSPEHAQYVAQHNPLAFAMSEKHPELAEKALNELLG